MFLCDEGPTIETLDFTFHIGSTLICHICIALFAYCCGNVREQTINVNEAHYMLIIRTVVMQSLGT